MPAVQAAESGHGGWSEERMNKNRKINSNGGLLIGERMEVLTKEEKMSERAERGQGC